MQVFITRVVKLNRNSIIISFIIVNDIKYNYFNVYTILNRGYTLLESLRTYI